MSLFDSLVDAAVNAQPALASQRAVVEKELLHHDVLREMATAGLLAGLVFIGGTCLRACYGAQRLSEDLDFTGGADFSKDQLSALGRLLEQRLSAKYGLDVMVSEPVRETGNVDTWKMKVVTRPERADMPIQRINIDICSIPSHDARPMMLRNYYDVDMGTGGLILQAESREEILADKMIALALRPNRVKNRDLWDIGWLVREGIQLPLSLIPLKLQDHGCSVPDYLAGLAMRVEALQSDPAMQREFVKEMQRFLPVQMVQTTVVQTDFWVYLTTQIADLANRVRVSLG